MTDRRRTVMVVGLSLFALVMFTATLASLPLPVLIACYTGVLVIVSVLATLFPISYQIRSAGLWRKSFAGRIMMLQGIVVALLLDFTLVGMINLLPIRFMVVLGILLLGALTIVKLGLLKMVLRFNLHPLVEWLHGLRQRL